MVPDELIVMMTPILFILDFAFLFDDSYFTRAKLSSGVKNPSLESRVYLHSSPAAVRKDRGRRAWKTRKGESIRHGRLVSLVKQQHIHHPVIVSASGIRCGSQTLPQVSK